MHQVLNDEKSYIDKYLNDFSDKVKIIKISVKFTHLIFEYKLTLKREDK